MKARDASIPIIVALIGLCGVLGAALINNWDDIVGNGRPTDPAPVVPTITVRSPTPSDPDTNPPTDAPPVDGTSVCVVTIDNPLVSLMSEPDQFSQEIIRVQPGDYQTLDYTVKTFVNEQRGWFQIEAEGRTGWIQNNTWTIAGKTSACP